MLEELQISPFCAPQRMDAEIPDATQAAPRAFFWTMPVTQRHDADSYHSGMVRQRLRVCQKRSLRFGSCRCSGYWVQVLADAVAACGEDAAACVAD